MAECTVQIEPDPLERDIRYVRERMRAFESSLGFLYDKRL